MTLKKTFLLILLIVYMFWTTVWTKLFAMEWFNFLEIKNTENYFSTKESSQELKILKKNINCFYQSNNLVFQDNNLFKFCKKFYLNQIETNKTYIKPLLENTIINNKSPPEPLNKKEKFLDFSYIVWIVLMLN